MRSALLSLVSLSISLALFANDAGRAPALAELAKDPIVHAYFADLLRQGDYGFSLTESAAFLVREESGAYRCDAWTYDGGMARHTFRGLMPDGTVAIMHTHPKERPHASADDFRTAMTLWIPIFVLTPTNIFVVTPRGESETIVANQKWWPVSGSSTARCTVPSLSATR